MTGTASTSKVNDIYEEIDRFDFTDDEKTTLYSFFINNLDKKGETEKVFTRLQNKGKVDLLRKLLNSEQPGASGFLLTEEALSQIKFIYEYMKANSETASLSSVNVDRFQQFLEYTKLTVRPVHFRGKYPRGDIVPYRWSTHAENHKQRKKIIEYFNNHLKPLLPEDVAIEDVANKKDFLNIRKSSVFPFNIRGGTDVILVEKDCVVGKILKPGIRATIELKKVVEESHFAQALLEMLAADCFVNKDVKVFGVLTDLSNVWNIFWLSENKEIIVVTLTSRKTAFEVINKMIRSNNPRISGISDTKRMKYMDLFDGRLNDPHDDIAPMENFYDEMDENEVLMHKTKKAIYALKDNPIFSSMLESPPDSFTEFEDV